MRSTESAALDPETVEKTRLRGFIDPLRAEVACAWGDLDAAVAHLRAADAPEIIDIAWMDRRGTIDDRSL